MSKYYVVFEKPVEETLQRDGYIFEFNHECPTEEELVKAMNDILGGTDKGSIIFMQKLYVEDPFAELINMSTPLSDVLSNMKGEENAEQQ